jgi:hypothetical protein
MKAFSTLGLLSLLVLSCGDGADPRDPLDPCQFEIAASTSPVIPTVGILEWSAALGEVQTAHVDFGLDSTYGLTAPVDLLAPGFRTLLLGMKPSSAYHFRIVASGASGECTSQDQTLETGALTNTLTAVTVNHQAPEPPQHDFLVSGFLLDGPAFILDGDGDYVWAFGSGDVARANLSYDGRHLWYTATNVAGNGPSMQRVSVDGLEEADFTAEFGDIHHDFTVLEDETVAFLQHDGPTDRIVERSPNGELSVIFDLAEVAGDVAANHANSIHYSKLDDSYTVSDLVHNAIFKVTRSGEHVWTLGGEHSDFSGDGAVWEVQHGHHVLAPDRLLIFSNGPAGSPSHAFEVLLDESAGTATRVWEYESGERTVFFGDVQRLENENTLVSYSAIGVVHEVNPNGELEREFVWELGGASGYLTRRTSLYGPPPK